MEGKLFIRLFLPPYHLFEVDQPPQWYLSQSGHKSKFQATAKEGLYSCRFDCLAMHDTYICQRRTLQCASHLHGVLSGLTINVTAADHDISILPNTQSLYLPQDERHASRCENSDAVSDP